MVLLVLTGVLSVLAIPVDLPLGESLARTQERVAERLRTGSVEGAELEARESQVLALLAIAAGAGLRLAPLLGTGLAFLTWLYMAYCNLPALGARELRFSPDSAVGSFFVPVMHLVRPYQVVREVWAASDLPGSDAAARQRARVPRLLGWWWALWVASAAVGLYAAGPHAFIVVLGVAFPRALAISIPALAATTGLTSVGGEDYCRGMAAFQVDDLARTRVLPIRNRRGRSLAGQGLTARRRRFRLRGARS